MKYSTSLNPHSFVFLLYPTYPLLLLPPRFALVSYSYYRELAFRLPLFYLLFSLFFCSYYPSHRVIFRPNVVHKLFIPLFLLPDALLILPLCRSYDSALLRR